MTPRSDTGGGYRTHGQTIDRDGSNHVTRAADCAAGCAAGCAEEKTIYLNTFNI